MKNRTFFRTGILSLLFSLGAFGFSGIAAAAPAELYPGRTRYMDELSKMPDWRLTLELGNQGIRRVMPVGVTLGTFMKPGMSPAEMKFHDAWTELLLRSRRLGQHPAAKIQDVVTQTPRVSEGMIKHRFTPVDDGNPKPRVREKRGEAPFMSSDTVE